MSFATAVTNPIVAVLGGGRDVQAAEGGSYFMARTPTLGTGIIGGASVQTFDELKPCVCLVNNGPYSVYLTQLRTHLTVVGANATPTIDNWTFTLDFGNRYTSGGTALTVINTNGTTQMNSGAFVQVGALTCTAATPKRRVVGHFTAKADDEADGGVEVVHDTMVVSFGDTASASSHSVRANTTTPCYNVYGLPPVVIAPGQSWTAVRWAGSQTTGSTHEYILTWMEK
jgi:hypothetical protein